MLALLVIEDDDDVEGVAVGETGVLAIGAGVALACAPPESGDS